MLMKKLILALIVALLTLTGAEARTYVLVTGVSNYNDSKNNLTQSTKDAKRFKKLMETQTKDITILTSKNATPANIIEKLTAICNRAQAGDRIIFFYSGHGYKGGLAAYGAALPYNELNRVLAGSAASEKIVFIDACLSGSMADPAPGTSWIDELRRQGHHAFFVSSRADEGSRETALLGSGLMTQALLKGLRGKADKNGDREVTVMELFKYIANDVQIHSNKQQHPQLIAPEGMRDVVLMKW